MLELGDLSPSACWMGVRSRPQSTPANSPHPTAT